MVFVFGVCIVFNFVKVNGKYEVVNVIFDNKVLYLIFIDFNLFIGKDFEVLWDCFGSDVFISQNCFLNFRMYMFLFNMVFYFVF